MIRADGAPWLPTCRLRLIRFGTGGNRHERALVKACFMIEAMCDCQLQVGRHREGQEHVCLGQRLYETLWPCDPSDLHKSEPG